MATRRREWGTGSLYQRASDGRWIGTVDAGYSKNGTRRRPQVSAKTEDECRKKLKRLIAEVEIHGAPTGEQDKRVTVRTWGDDWLAIIVTQVRPKTYLNNRTAVRRWIVPTIGHKRLESLSPADVRAVANAVRKADLSSSTALRAHMVLMKMLKDAIVEGHRVPQRVLMTTSPAVATNDRDAVPLADALAMMKAAPTNERAMWASAFLQGLRQGERLGLAWPCIDFKNHLMDVSWQLQALNYEHGCNATCGRATAKACPAKRLRVPDGYEFRQLDGTLCLVRPKTEKGQRIIPLVPWMEAALVEWRDLAPDSPHGLVWPRGDGRPQTARADLDAWRALQAAADVTGPEGRSYHLHEARHSTATLLLEAGVDAEVIKAIMGHASILTTRIYQHVPQSMTRKALEGLAERLELTSSLDR